MSKSLVPATMLVAALLMLPAAPSVQAQPPLDDRISTAPALAAPVVTPVTPQTRTAAAKGSSQQIELVPGEPETAAGYQAMFDAVDTDEWGGGDVTISARLDDGRRIWLHGDTLSGNNGFVHSSALIQTGSTLDVANGGQQILPNHEKQPSDGTKVIYWIETVQPKSGSRVKVTAAPMRVKPGDPWGFKRFSRKSRTAILEVDPYGDVFFTGWKKWVKRPNIGMDGEDVKVLGPNHYAYAVFVHDIRLANGNYLRTRNQNWDDAFENHIGPDGLLSYHDWRPFFEESKTRRKPYWGR